MLESSPPMTANDAPAISTIEVSPTTEPTPTPIPTPTSVCTPPVSCARNLLPELDANLTPAKVQDPCKVQATAAESCPDVPASAGKKVRDAADFDVALNEAGLKSLLICVYYMYSRYTYIYIYISIYIYFIYFFKKLFIYVLCPAIFLAGRNGYRESSKRSSSGTRNLLRRVRMMASISPARPREADEAEEEDGARLEDADQGDSKT